VREGETTGQVEWHSLECEATFLAPPLLRVHFEREDLRLCRACGAVARPIAITLCEGRFVLSMPIIAGTLRGRRAIWRALHKADNPRSLIDRDLGFRSGKIEPHVCRTQECRGICIIHQPSSLSLLPTRGRTEFAAQVDE
jgi:hypothetical protein